MITYYKVTLSFFFLLFELCQNVVELSLYARIHSVSIILKDETANQFRVHLGLELHSTLRSLLHHLAHLLLRRGVNGSGGDQLTADDVLLFPVKSDIRSSHELQGALPILFQDESDELLAQFR